MAKGNVREYQAGARSTDVFGRVLCDAREQHFVIDGPVWNGCPGEALTPGEAFLAGVAGCGVELSQVIAAEDGLTLGAVGVRIHGIVDRERPVRDDMTVFNRVGMRFTIEGVTDARVAQRCPLYGSVAASAGEFAVEIQASGSRAHREA